MEDKGKIVDILNYLWSILEPKVEYVINRPEWSIPVGLSIIGLIIAYKNYLLNRKKIKNLINEQNEKTLNLKETKQKELWEIFPNWIQYILARLGWIEVDVRAGDTLFYFFTTGEMLRKSSFEGKLHYIRSQEFSSQRIKEHYRRKAIHQNAIWLYEHLITSSGSLEEREKASNLKEESQKNLKDYNDQEYKIKNEEWKKERNSRLISNFRRGLKSIDVGYEDKLLTVTGDNSEWLFRGYLWYVHGCETSSRVRWYKETGELVELGEPIISYYGIQLLNPVKGFLVKVGGHDQTFEWGIIPIKNSQIPKDVGEIVFGELIETVHSLIKRRRYEKYSEHSLLNTIQELKSTKLLASDIDQKTKKLLNLAEVNN